MKILAMIAGLLVSTHAFAQGADYDFLKKYHGQNLYNSTTGQTLKARCIWGFVFAGTVKKDDPMVKHLPPNTETFQGYVFIVSRNVMCMFAEWELFDAKGKSVQVSAPFQVPADTDVDGPANLPTVVKDEKIVPSESEKDLFTYSAEFHAAKASEIVYYQNDKTPSTSTLSDSEFKAAWKQIQDAE